MSLFPRFVTGISHKQFMSSSYLPQGGPIISPLLLWAGVQGSDLAPGPHISQAPSQPMGAIDGNSEVGGTGEKPHTFPLWFHLGGPSSERPASSGQAQWVQSLGTTNPLSLSLR